MFFYCLLIYHWQYRPQTNPLQNQNPYWYAAQNKGKNKDGQQAHNAKNQLLYTYPSQNKAMDNRLPMQGNS